MIHVLARCRVVCIAAFLLATGWQPALAQFDFGGGFSRKGSEAQVTLESQFSPATTERPALLFVTATIADGFHVYAIDQTVLPDGGGGPLATKISLTADGSVQLLAPWQALEKPSTHIDKEIWTGLELREHSKKVTWFVPIRLPQEVDPASLAIAAQIEGQACNPQTCIPFEQDFTARQGSGIPLPAGVTFAVQKTPVAETPPAAIVPSALRKDRRPAPAVTPTASANKSPARIAPSQVATNSYDLSRVSLTATQEGSVFYYLMTAFLGGIVLNVMPCVLPVIGLKVMSFVQQAGQSRAHALALNCWYAAGIVAVFLALAGLAVSFQLSWGSQFSSAGFNIALIGIVFAMALSLLGMWEIPIPGFVGSSAAVEITEREGPAAAFLKGILTTLLATPCTGPLMAPALAWAVRQPAWMTFSVFGVLGLGMASPYLLIGAFPNLIRFLPKPGAWMETFKKIMGLILLATVVWLMTSIDMPLAVPTVALLVGIVAACWWISQTPAYAPISEKAYGWVTAIMIIAISAMTSYGWLYRDVMKPRFEKKIAKFAEEQIGNERLRIATSLSQLKNNKQLRAFVSTLSVGGTDEDNQDWQNFTLSKLGNLTLGEGRTVLVDFTADWCLTCKALEKLVLKTQPVEEALTSANVVTMEADFTKRPKEVDRTIKALGGVGVPLIAIFPANDPYHPIVFADGQYTKGALIEAIAQATGRADLLEGNTTMSQNDDRESRR